MASGTLPAMQTRTASERRLALKELVSKKEAALLPGAANPLTARIIEDIGFQAVYLTGAGLTNMSMGLPDLGLVTASDVVEATARFGDVCSLPIIVDMDTGFGNALNAYHSVRRLEQAGAAGIQLEDQVFPKKCGHFDGKQVVPLDEYLAKLKACLDARQDDNLMIVARTDARSVEGFDAAMDRAHAMIETGADLIFVEAPESIDEIGAIGKLPAPTLINLVFGGKTPMPSRAELAEAGFSLVLYANAALQASVHATQEVLGSLMRHGDLAEVKDRLTNFSERQRLVGKPEVDALIQRYEGA